MALTPPANAVLVEITDGTNAMPTADNPARALYTRLNDGSNNLGLALNPTGDGYVPGAQYTIPVIAYAMLFNGTNYDRQRSNFSSQPLAQQVGTVATRNSADQTNFNGRGIILHVKIAGLANIPTYTPQIQMKSFDGTYLTIWTAAAALTLSGDKSYVLYPGNVDTGGHVEAKQIAIPRTFRVNLNYTGNGTTDSANTTVNMETIL